MKDKKINRSTHCGLTMGESFLTTLMKFYHEMIGLADLGRIVDIVYLDFSKAFDTVSQKILRTVRGDKARTDDSNEP